MELVNSRTEPKKDKAVVLHATCHKVKMSMLDRGIVRH